MVVTPFHYRYDHSNSAKYVGEFVGTYFIVLVVGCNVLTGSLGAALSIGALLVAMAYAIGPVSGGHMNPAVTMAVAIKLMLQKKQVEFHLLVYMLVQIVAGILAGLTFSCICGSSFAVAPVGRHSGLTAFLVEVIYTGALCYVFLSVSSVKAEDNQHYGLAIGFVVIAAIVAAGGISGCSLNPAVAVGAIAANASFFGIKLALAYAHIYLISPVVAAILGASLFWIVNPDEFHAKLRN